MEEKLINLVKNEFENDFGIFIEDNNTELHLVGRQRKMYCKNYTYS